MASSGMCAALPSESWKVKILHCECRETPKSINLWPLEKGRAGALHILSTTAHPQGFPHWLQGQRHRHTPWLTKSVPSQKSFPFLILCAVNWGCGPHLFYSILQRFHQYSICKKPSAGSGKSPEYASPLWYNCICYHIKWNTHLHSRDSCVPVCG